MVMWVGISYGHVGRDKLYHVLRDRFYWPGMYTDIRRWVSACVKCRQIKDPQPKSHGLLQPIKTTYPFEIVGIDILGPLKTTARGYKYILVFVDYFTNWVEACPLKTLEADEVAERFYSTIIVRHGCPTKVITDQGTQFTAAVFKKLCTKFKIFKLEASAKHPQTNGKTERFIRFLTTALATVIAKDQGNWDLLLDSCLFAYRVTINRTIQETPFFLLYGRDAVLPGDIVFEAPRGRQPVNFDDLVEYKADLLRRLRHSYEQIEAKLDKEMQYYKNQYDKTHKEVKFKIGDLMMVYWPVPKKGFTKKLLPKWQGPFKIVAKISPLTYRIEKDAKTIAIHVQRLLRYTPFTPNESAV